jgi:hypothetical protein
MNVSSNASVLARPSGGRDGARAGARAFLLTVAAAVGVLVTAGMARAAARKKSGQEEDGEVSPAEDLMRDHGVLRRFLVYEEALRRLEGKRDFPAEHVRSGAGIIRRFIEAPRRRPGRLGLPSRRPMRCGSRPTGCSPAGAPTARGNGSWRAGSVLAAARFVEAQQLGEPECGARREDLLGEVLLLCLAEGPPKRRLL